MSPGFSTGVPTLLFDERKFKKRYARLLLGAYDRSRKDISLYFIHSSRKILSWPGSNTHAKANASGCAPKQKIYWLPAYYLIWKC